MDSEHRDRKLFVTVRDGSWRRGRQRGTVAARVPIAPHPDFCEVAVLLDGDGRRLTYAARLIGSDQWARFRNLQPWMYPLVEELLATLGANGRLAEICAQARRVLERASGD